MNYRSVTNVVNMVTDWRNVLSKTMKAVSVLSVGQLNIPLKHVKYMYPQVS